MGYFTIFHLYVYEENGYKPIDEFHPSFHKIVCYINHLLGEGVAEDFFKYHSYEAKWYNWKNDMKDMAKAFPSLYFELEGRGEDLADWWQAVFHGTEASIRQAQLIPPEDSAYKPL